MKTIEKTKPVLVTGGSGYIASWIIKLLLEDGHTVHTTVRNKVQQNKYGHLVDIAKKSKGDLKIFEADLLKVGGFDEATAGCELVMHTASPFFINGLKDARKELIEPAKSGTRNVLESANRSKTVKRVVLTSSMAAIYGDNKDVLSTPNGILTEDVWNTSSSISHQPYSFSKTIAEKEAWEMVEKQDQWDLVTINPGFVLGPSLTKRTDSTSISTIIQMADGTFKSGAPELWFGIVDVRDVAKAHIKAGYTPEAKGRHITCNESASFYSMAQILRKQFGSDYPFPKSKVPKALIWLIAPKAGLTRKFVLKNIGIKLNFDNTKSRRELGMDYIPIDKTLKDQFEQLVEDGLVVKK
ncbi:MAG: aldehyde reductase [Bacteroidales bacterium]|nr:aldehyde reductase [Bacteroidales bacterium]MCF8405587.1 aldehyde reductase [Bacteroidales bacterium]